MIQIEDTLVSFDIFEKKFCCDLASCKGACCVEGDAGAPLEADEPGKIEANYEGIKIFMKPAGIDAVRQQGFAVIDVEGDLGTPLINGGECAYAIEENGICWCAIEKAWTQGLSDFRKPLSCHLYPIRIENYGPYTAVNYHRWDVCKAAVVLGKLKGVPVYQFLKEPLIRKFGADWYQMLSDCAEEWTKQNRGEDEEKY